MSVFLGIAFLVILMCVAVIPMLMQASGTSSGDIRKRCRRGFREGSAVGDPKPGKASSPNNLP